MSRRFQFSIAALLVLTAFIAVVLALMYQAPNKVGLPALALLTLASPAILTVAAINSRGVSRSFCIGCLFPIASSFLRISLGYTGQMIDWRTLDTGNMDPEFVDQSQYHLGFSILYGVAVGLVSVAVHLLLASRSSRSTPLAAIFLLFPAITYAQKTPAYILKDSSGILQSPAFSADGTLLLSSDGGITASASVPGAQSSTAARPSGCRSRPTSAFPIEERICASMAFLR